MNSDHTHFNDRDSVIEFYRDNPLQLEHASEELKHDEEIVLTAVSQNGNALQYASEKLRNHIDVVMEAVFHDINAIQYAAIELRNDQVFMRDVMNNYIHQVPIFQHAGENLKNNKNFVLDTIAEDPDVIRFASELLRNDEYVATEALKHNSSLFAYIGDSLKNNKKFVQSLICNHTIYVDVRMVLLHAGDDITNDRDIVLAVVAQDGLALEFVSEGFNFDLEVVMTAVTKDGSALQFANNELRNDRNFVKAVMHKQGSALAHVSEELRNDEEVVLAAVTQDGNALQYASERLRGDKAMALASVCQNVGSLSYVSEALKTDISFQKAAIELKPSSIGELKITKERLGQIYGMLNPSKVIKKYPEDGMLIKRFYEDSISGIISGLIVLTTGTSMYLNNQRLAMPCFHERERTKTALNNYQDIQAKWNDDISGRIGEYLSLKDVVSLMATPANRYVVAKNGGKRPFNPNKDINFLINISSDVSLFSVDTKQRLVREAEDGKLPHGRHLTVHNIPEEIRTFICNK